MLKRPLTALTVALFLSATGCGLQKGETLVKYERGKSPRMAKALVDGTYALYSSTDATPKVKFYVRKGEEVGFRQSDDGGVIAIAGDNPPQPIEGKLAPNHYWKQQK
jgi:hypothetical protein